MLKMPSRRSGGAGTTRRKHSLGNLRRAHPASGATWNVQVVRGKMSSKCLWHACRALILGLTLMLVGAGMATLGYYADHLSMGSELRGNVTVRVKNDLKGFHLNNFSYVGPIVMGFGGFIVVASCVMTFEARDSAAKVVPARLRAGGGSCNKSMARSNQGSSASQRRGMGEYTQSLQLSSSLVYALVFVIRCAVSIYTLGSALWRLSLLAWRCTSAAAGGGSSSSRHSRSTAAAALR